eukprot:g19183.t1
MEYEVLFLQFAGGLIVALEEAQDGHVIKEVGGEVKMVGDRLLLSLDLFISNCCRDIDCLSLSTPLTYSNLSPTERVALSSLRSNPNLTIKPTDKGGAVVVWRTDLYIEEARHQLSDTSSYRPLDHDPTP